MNRLQFESSPYLLQHADNPVDWYPWGPEALERARAEDKPILLSVGYSACHWCHVMAHESFENEATAAIMNQNFINIKVDREERPDIDDIYMQAVQAMSGGHGGWPMTVFLTPDGRPFYGGTYYPPEPRYGMPSFPQLLDALHDAYSNRRDDVLAQAGQLSDALSRDRLSIGGQNSELSSSLLAKAAEGMMRNFDATHGGFGGAPKFPQPMNLEFLLRSYHRDKAARTLAILTFTLEKMARGGIYDQLGGGFHRYSVDALWLVPHFEKMLYDNAQLSRVYLHTWQVTHNPFFKRIAEEIYDYILREMTAPEGGFYSTTDADSEGEEGKFFVWSKEELEQLLGDDAAVAIEYWGVSTHGNFEGHNILFVPNDDMTVAQRLGLNVTELHAQLDKIRDKLYAVRTQRVHPGLDDKILAAWNGMMLTSLAEAARVLERGDYRIAAVRAGEFILSTLIRDGRVLRTYKAGVARIDGYLEDYAQVTNALLALYQTTFDERYFVQARQLADYVLEHFRAPDGGFYDTSDEHETLIVRPRNLQDNATPAGFSVMARALIQLTALTGDPRYDDAARASLRLLTEAFKQYPQAFGEALCALDMLVEGLSEVAVVGEPTDPATLELLATIQTTYRPNTVTALSPTGQGADAVIPLLAERPMLDGQPTVYVCRHFACQRPVNTVEALKGLL